MKFLHCNRCKTKMQGGVINWITTCYHTFCDNCTKARTEKDKCIICKTICTFMIINKDLPDEYKMIFREPCDYLKNFLSCYSFHMSQKKLWRSHCDYWVRMYAEGQRILHQELDVQKKLDVEATMLQREFTYLKSMEVSLKQELDIGHMRDHDTPTPKAKFGFGQRISPYNGLLNYRNTNNNNNLTVDSNSTLNTPLNIPESASTWKGNRYSPYYRQQQSDNNSSMSLNRSFLAPNNHRLKTPMSVTPHMVCQRPIDSLLNVSCLSNYPKTTPLVDSSFHNQIRNLNINTNPYIQHQSEMRNNVPFEQKLNPPSAASNRAFGEMPDSRSSNTTFRKLSGHLPNRPASGPPGGSRNKIFNSRPNGSRGRPPSTPTFRHDDQFNKHLNGNKSINREFTNRTESVLSSATKSSRLPHIQSSQCVGRTPNRPCGRNPAAQITNVVHNRLCTSPPLISQE